MFFERFPDRHKVTSVDGVDAGEDKVNLFDGLFYSNASDLLLRQRFLAHGARRRSRGLLRTLLTDKVAVVALEDGSVAGDGVADDAFQNRL